MNKAFAVMALMLMASFSFAGWFNSTWQQCLPFNITNTGGKNLTNYTTELYFDLNESKTNGSDLRIIWDNGTLNTTQNFWRETCSNNTSQTFCWNYSTASGAVWMNATSILNKTAPTQYYACYNASGVADFSNGTKTFPVFTDCSGATVDTSFWNNTGATTTDGNGVCNFSTSYYSNATLLHSFASMTGVNNSYVGRVSAKCNTGVIHDGTQIDPLTAGNGWGQSFSCSASDTWAGSGYNGTKDPTPNGTLTYPALTWHREKATANPNNATWQTGNFSAAPMQTDNAIRYTVKKYLSFGRHTATTPLIYVDWAALSNSYEYPLTIAYGAPINYTSSNAATVDYAANSQADGSAIEPPLFVNATTNMNACNLTVNGTNYAMTFIGAAPNGSCSASISLSDGAYSYFVYAYNSSNLSMNASSGNRSVIIDTALPTNLNFISPTASAQYYVATTPTIDFNLSFAEPLGIANCTASINGTTYNMTRVNSSLCTQALANSAANFSYSGSVCDLAGHCASTGTFNISGFNYSYSVGFSNPESDIAPDNITLDLSTQNYAGSLAAILQYNGANYTPTQTASGFYYVATPPTLSGNNSTVSIVWYYSFLNSTPVLNANTSNTTSLLFANITDCSVVNGTRILTFSYYDQASVATSTNSTMDATFTLTAANGNYSRNFSFNFSTPAPNVSLCLSLSNGSYYVDSIQQFRASGYRNLYYYLLNQSISVPTAYNVNLYNLNATGSVATQYIILQGASQALENAYVQVLRYYPATNQLILVSMGKSNVNGIAESYAIANEVNYRYVVIKDNQILFTSGTATLPCDPSFTLCSSTIYVNNVQPNEYSSFINSVGVGCVANQTVGTVYCTSNNPSGTGTRLTLRLYEIGTYSNPLICENSVNSGSGTVICSIPSPTKAYYYVGSATIGSDVIIGNGMIGGVVRAAFDSTMGLFATVLLVGGFAAFGILFGLVGVIIGADLGLVISVLLGFLSLNPVYLVPVLSISLVVAWVLAIAQSPRG